MKIVIGTRGSALARVQADMAAKTLKDADASLEIEIRIVETTGDVNQAPIPLDANGKGWFTKEIEEELLAEKIDIAVHSLKDVADEMPAGLVLAAYLPREDARDVLVTKDGQTLEALKAGARVGTDSARRKVQLLALRSDLNIESVRGNVPTRLAKLDAGEYDAVVLAAAGLKRLGLQGRITRYFEQSEMTSAPGQGIMAIQARARDADLLALLAKINDAEAAHAAHIERAFSHALGGGCKSPTGAYASREGESMRLVGMTQGVNGVLIRGESSAPIASSEHLGDQLAQELLAKSNV